MRSTVIIAAAVAAGFGLGTATPAFAACQDQTAASDQVESERSPGDENRDATEVIREMVDNAEATDTDTPAYVENGPAEPRENWFGCGPSSEAEACEESDAAKSRIDRTETTKSPLDDADTAKSRLGEAETRVAADTEHPEDAEETPVERTDDDAGCGAVKAR